MLTNAQNRPRRVRVGRDTPILIRQLLETDKVLDGILNDLQAGQERENETVEHTDGSP